jgi:hypothetical protein
MTVSATAVFESVTVNAAVRCAPVLAATANAIVPSPAPDAPCVTVRNAALLTAPHVHVLGVLMEIDADPPDAGNDVVVFPVITWHPPAPLDPLGDEGLPPQAVAATRNTTSDTTRTSDDK